MKTNELLANIRVASPCSARWGHMIGDDRVRICTQCDRHVYNLSNLTAEQAATLIRQREGQLCARFYRRSDGMILTADCPVGSRDLWARVKRLVTAAAALAVLGAVVPLVAKEANTEDLPMARTRLHRAWDDALFTFRSFLGIQPRPVATMGDICVVAPASPPATRATGKP